jgi:uncharacterized protein YegL
MNTTTQNASSILSEYNIYLLIDKSGSMAMPNKESDQKGRTRWQAVQETAVQIAYEADKIDTDGLDVILFGGSSIQEFKGVHAADVKKIFDTNNPSGTTPLTQALLKLFSMAAADGGKKDLAIVFTDGVPDEPATVKKAIIDRANRSETDDEITLLFIQVGDDQSARSYLKSLDDELKGAKFDIVDAKTQDEAEQFSSIPELILAAIND